MGITFSSSIDLGHILEAFVSIIAFVGIIYTLRSDVKGLKIDMTTVKAEMQKITNVMISIARQDERLSAMDQRIDDLVHRGHHTDGK